MSVCPCAVCPARPIPCPSGSPRGAVAGAVPVSSPSLFKALCDDGLAAASILVLLGGGAAPCSGDRGSGWEPMPAWCRVCRSLWLSARRCERPRALQLRRPRSLLPPALCPALPFSSPSLFSCLALPCALSHAVCTTGDARRKTCSRLPVQPTLPARGEGAETRRPPPTLGFPPFPTMPGYPCPPAAP